MAPVSVAFQLPRPSRGSPRGLQRASDEALVDALRGGDARAFELLYERHHRALLAFCRHMLGSREEAEDALQLVFVSAHAHFDRDGRPVAVRAFLYAVARNRCLSVLRARRDVVALDSVAEPATDGLALAAEVECRQDLRDLLGDVATLPEEQRAALILAELDDLSHEEIAVALDVRKEKVKALVFQAREALMALRTARSADCREIQEQLASLRGNALRRAPLRRHVAVCGACAAFEGEVNRQRAAIAVILPVIPSLALKGSVFSAIAGGGAVAASGAATAGLAASGAAATGAAGGFGAGLAAKVAAVAVLAAGAGGGAVAVTRDAGPPERRAPASSPAGLGATPATVAPRAPGTGGPAALGTAGPASSEPRDTRGRRAEGARKSRAGRGRAAEAKAAAAAAKRARAAAGRKEAAAERKAQRSAASRRPAATTPAKDLIGGGVHGPTATPPRPARSTKPPAVKAPVTSPPARRPARPLKPESRVSGLDQTE